nr:hypothetical protein [Tanacetum cinerariifolium]
MRTKRKLIPKSNISSSAGSGQHSVVGKSGYDNVCNVDSGVPLKKQCMCPLSSVPCHVLESGVGPSVFPNTQCAGHLNSLPYNGEGFEGSGLPDVALSVPQNIRCIRPHERHTSSYTRRESTTRRNSLCGQPRVSSPPSEYKHIGNCTHTCQHCGALFWYKERLKSSMPRGSRSRYNHCCKGGQVALRTYQIYPEYMKLLLEDRYFLENIRAYNQMFSMTSLGAQVDESINNGRGPYVFKISGQLYHWIGALQSDIVEGLIELLDAHNALVQLFRTAREKLQDVHILNFKARLYNVVGAREYELPTRGMLGAIVYEPGLETDMDYDIIIKERSGYPQRVNKLHPSYMSLRFPLLFIYGQDGYSKELRMVSPTGSSSEQKRNRVDYVREHQNNIMNEYLSGIYYAINRGDNDGSDCGSRLILPQSFTDESAQVRKEEDIDVYISVELPPEDVDPECYRVVSELMMHGPCGVAYPSASWLHYNEHNTDGRHLTYLNFPYEFVWRSILPKDATVSSKRL